MDFNFAGADFGGADYGGSGFGDMEGLEAANLPAPKYNDLGIPGYRASGALSDRKGKLAKIEHRDSRARFGPVEEQLIGYATNEGAGPGGKGTIQSDVAEARSNVVQAFDSGKKGMGINLSRYGATLDADQQKVSDRMHGLAKTKSTVDADNRTRINTGDRQQMVRGQLVNLGRGIKSSGTSNMTTVAGMENTRDIQNDQAEAADKQQKVSTAATIASIVAMAYGV